MQSTPTVAEADLIRESGDNIEASEPIVGISGEENIVRPSK